MQAIPFAIQFHQANRLRERTHARTNERTHARTSRHETISWLDSPPNLRSLPRVCTGPGGFARDDVFLGFSRYGAFYSSRLRALTMADQCAESAARACHSAAERWTNAARECSRAAECLTWVPLELAPAWGRQHAGKVAAVKSLCFLRSETPLVKGGLFFVCYGHHLLLTNCIDSNRTLFCRANL